MKPILPLLLAVLLVGPALAETKKTPAPQAAPERHAAKPAPAKVISPDDRAYGALQRGYYLTARDIALPLAKLGDPIAQTLLGEIYSRGLGVPRSDPEAAHWYEAASKAGNADGQFRYALMLLDGSAGRTDSVAARGLMKSAADAGIALAQYNYGQMLIEASPNSGFGEALPYFSKAASASVSDAQYAMSQMFAYGRGGLQADPEEARAYLAAAARNGHMLAQIELGIWMINGRGGAKNVDLGAGWLRRAAARGNPIAMNRLAHLYKDGIGVPASKVEAGKWSVLARRADNGDATLDEFFRKLDDDTKKAALEAANRFRPS
ncbi:tetratricopeptide repeat protein [Aureimonas psammosilenae]|uniref:tetratricopeptide repeat protein n=1 Tax=Aureimonas psammosilenae TaxID=2495496 RepID=UPI0012608996|nr:tetratricopeptide repeat protein [Aureimonas psammosilenae]